MDNYDMSLLWVYFTKAISEGLINAGCHAKMNIIDFSNWDRTLEICDHTKRLPFLEMFWEWPGTTLGGVLIVLLSVVLFSYLVDIMVPLSTM
jgi:hypothetical protein